MIVKPARTGERWMRLEGGRSELIFDLAILITHITYSQCSKCFNFSDYMRQCNANILTQGMVRKQFLVFLV